VPGSWSYTIASNQNDSGLQRGGTIDVRPAAAGVRGFLRRDPDNPQSFRFDSGERYFMMGQTYYEIVRAARSDAGSPPAWQTAVQKSHQSGMNKVRLLAYPWGGTEATSPMFFPDSYPFAGNNHDTLDIAHWSALDRVVRYLSDQGMVADVALFADTTSAFGTQAQDDRYIRYLMARYAAFPNVIWCLTNEWEFTGKPQTYWDHVGSIVRNEDPWMAQGGALRPLSIHNKTSGATGGKFSFFGSPWPVHAVIQYGTRNQQFSNGDQWGNYSITQNDGHGMPVVNDEYGYIGEANFTQTQHRNALWSIAMGGGYGSAGDARVFNDGPGGVAGIIIRSAVWHDAPEYQDIKRYADFWTTRGIRYWEMSEQNALVQSGARVYTLGKPNTEYVVYAAAGGTIKLAIPSGRNYQVTRYNPRDGSSATLGTISGASQWTLPDSNDWVLDIKGV
jgi:hypothetical protein